MFVFQVMGSGSIPSQSWIEFLKQQEPWVRELTEGTFYTDIPTVISRIREYNELIAVSDGSVHDPHMTFSWVLGDPDGTLIAKGYGPSNGRTSSLQGEALGMLAVSTFLGMLQKFTNYDLGTITVSFYADNSSLISCQCQQQEYERPYMNATLALEYDLTEQIYHTLKH